MRRLIGWTAGVVGVAALARMLARRRPAPKPVAAPPADDHAEASDAASAPTSTADVEDVEDVEDEAPRESLENRRARVHAKAQEAIDAMQEPLE